MKIDNSSRIIRKIHHTRNQRKRIRNYLFERDGNRCCWCGRPMKKIFGHGYHSPAKTNIEAAATIEHYFALEKNDPENIDYYKLAHKGCNK